jgi:hypothetical protein
MVHRKKESKPRKPLKREDVHKHPKQGTRPYRGPHAHRHPSEVTPWQPFSGYPMVTQAHAGGGAGFVATDVHVPGPFAGIGPRNYAKTDQRVLEDVCELLTRHGELDVREVDVHCRNGVIRLEGHVPARWMRREIEATAESVGGVVDVENELLVQTAE